ncbi:MAG: hypothetical protein DSY81_09660 [Bacillota bacterium]|nr:MAG: hypothetical protein DSY81_09660 [Bacillota bacterium]
MRRPGNPRFSGKAIGYRMTASKLIAGVLRIWVLVIVAVNATAALLVTGIWFRAPPIPRQESSMKLLYRN